MSERSVTGQPASRGRDASGSAAAALDSVVCFAIADKTYGLDVGVVREVVTVTRWIPVPHAAPAILGVFALRGATVALVDTRTVFGLAALGEPSTALVVASGHRTICALTIDRVLGVVAVAETQLTPAVRGRDPAQVAGFLASDAGGLVTVLDAAHLVHSLDRLHFSSSYATLTRRPT